MPTYEYVCRSCEERLEVVQSFADDALTVCEACGGELRKVFSAAGLIFKGSGWHVKDYASGSKAPSGGTASSSSSSDQPSKGESKGESKGDGSSEKKRDGSSEKKRASTGEGSGGTSGGASNEKRSSPTSTSSSTD